MATADNLTIDKDKLKALIYKEGVNSDYYERKLDLLERVIRLEGTFFEEEFIFKIMLGIIWKKRATI